MGEPSPNIVLVDIQEQLSKYTENLKKMFLYYFTKCYMGFPAYINNLIKKLKIYIMKAMD